MPELGVIGGWATHRTAEGREYYYNKETNTTTWEKPDVLKAAEEKGAAVSAAVATSSWKEFSDASGKKYYHNTKTKQTQWTMPDELKAAAAAEDAPAAGAAATEAGAAASSSAEPAVEDTTEERKQFVQMLESTAGVTAELTWEDAMRLIINNPTYRVLKTLAERKETFQGWKDAQLEVVEEAA